VGIDARNQAHKEASPQGTTPDGVRTHTANGVSRAGCPDQAGAPPAYPANNEEPRGLIAPGFPLDQRRSQMRHEPQKPSAKDQEEGVQDMGCDRKDGRWRPELRCPAYTKERGRPKPPPPGSEKSISYSLFFGIETAPPRTHGPFRALPAES